MTDVKPPTEKDMGVLLHIGDGWTDLGPSKPTRREKAPRAALRRLLDAGYVQVRTASYDAWVPSGPIRGKAQDGVEHWRARGYRVEAKLTDQGSDVRKALFDVD